MTKKRKPFTNAEQVELLRQQVANRPLDTADLVLWFQLIVGDAEKADQDSIEVPTTLGTVIADLLINITRPQGGRAPRTLIDKGLDIKVFAQAHDLKYKLIDEKKMSATDAEYDAAETTAKADKLRRGRRALTERTIREMLRHRGKRR